VKNTYPGYILNNEKTLPLIPEDLIKTEPYQHYRTEKLESSRIKKERGEIFRHH